MAIVSAIIPIYNAENTLRRCLDSIASQDLTGFEIILVDDGSTDSTLLICKEYVSALPEFKLIHKCNGGSSSARNAGLDVASGEWITFIDSDDEVSNDWAICLKKSINSISEEQDTLIIEDVTVLHVDGHHCQIYSNKKPANFRDIFSSDFAGSVCNKVFRKDIIDQSCLRFDISVKFCEDCLFVAAYASRMKKVHLIESPVYIQHLPESYNCKYYQYINYNYQLHFFQKIREINIVYSNCLVDGLFMSFTSSIQSQKKDYVLDAVKEFKKVVGPDIRYVKGLKKCLIRLLSHVNSVHLWYYVVILFIKF